MRRVYGLLLCLVWLGAWTTDALADEFKLTDGTTIWGAVSDANESGVVFRLDSGGFSPRISWGKFSDSTLEILASDPKMREFAEPFIPIPPEARPKPKPVVVNEDYPKVELPAGRTTIFSSLTTPIGLAMLGLLYLANLLAAYEVARYRNRPVSVVCGLSAVLPLAGPLAFLASPSLEEAPGEYEEPEAEEEPEAAPAPPREGRPGGATSRRVGAPPRSSSLRMVASTKGSDQGAREKRVYHRNEHTFNRRFIETQFSGFFRVVPTDAEKDMVLVIRTPKQEYVARRISRITASEMYVQLIQAGSKEVRVALGEIEQIILRHKNDKS